MGEEPISTKRLYAAILVAVLGGNLTGIANIISPAARNDPMTGTEGRRQSLELHRIDRIQYAMDLRMKQREKEAEAMLELLQQHMREHP